MRGLGTDTIASIREEREEGLSFRDITASTKVSLGTAYKYGRNIIQKTEKWRLKLCKKIRRQDNRVDAAKTRIIGHCLWNGSVSNKRRSSYAINYCTCSLDLIKQFRRDMRYVYGFKFPPIRFRKGKNIDYYETRYYSKLACQDLLRYAVTYRSTLIPEIPRFVWKTNEQIQKEFLRTFWEDEGSITATGKIKATLKIANVLLQLKKLHEKYGISCHVGPDRTTDCNFLQLHLSPDSIRAFWHMRPFVHSVVERGKNCGKKKSQVFINTYSHTL